MSLPQLVRESSAPAGIDAEAREIVKSLA